MRKPFFSKSKVYGGRQFLGTSLLALSVSIRSTFCPKNGKNQEKLYTGACRPLLVLHGKCRKKKKRCSTVSSAKRGASDCMLELVVATVSTFKNVKVKLQT